MTDPTIDSIRQALNSLEAPQRRALMQEYLTADDEYQVGINRLENDMCPGCGVEEADIYADGCVCCHECWTRQNHATCLPARDCDMCKADGKVVCPYRMYLNLKP